MTPALLTITLALAPSRAPGFVEVVTPYSGVFMLALVVSLFVTPIMRSLALRNGVVDRPDLVRKCHVKPIAYLGGVAIFLGWLAGVTICYFTVPHADGSGSTGMGFVSFPMAIILGAGAITLTGLFDDIYHISPRVKVGGQLFAAAALALQQIGLSIAKVSLEQMEVSWPPSVVYLLGTLLLATFVLGGCNSMNLLDGMDGLAAGVTAIACLGFLVIAGLLAVRIASGEVSADPQIGAVTLVMCLAMLGAVLGFLPYNFNPATIFMGDAGSLLLGFLCVSVMLLFADIPGAGPKLIAAAMVVFALPIIDTSLAIVRRKMAGKPIFSPDDGHLHHLLRRAGLSVRQSVAVLYSLAIFFALLGGALVAVDARLRYILPVFLTVYVASMFIAYRFGQRLPRPRTVAETSLVREPEPVLTDESVAGASSERLASTGANPGPAGHVSETNSLRP